MGSTHYFTTSSDGNNTILYPPNHYIIAGTSKNSFGEGQDHMSSIGYVGSQHPIPDKFNVVEGGVIVDPLNIDTATSASVNTQEVVGSFTDQAITVINNNATET